VPTNDDYCQAMVVECGRRYGRAMGVEALM
jgi:hypothetical protein